jgi:hypothetical protein
LLLRILLDDEPHDLRPAGAQIFTTGLWYHRLCRALTDDTVTGTFSRALGDADPGVARSAVQAIASLPPFVDLVSPRSLAWPMAQLLSEGVRLNLLSLEALAAAEHLGAGLCLAVADENPRLRAAASARNVAIRHVGDA